MVKKIILSLLLLFSVVRCTDGIELDIQDMGDEYRIFVECYCRPGELYNLTATYLSPIDEIQNLDYSHAFAASITDTATHKLYRSLFYIGNYIYSHGSPSRLPEDFKGELLLEIVSPVGDTLVAASSVPDDVAIAAVEEDSGSVTVSFEASDDSSQNYYSVSLNVYDVNNNLLESRLRFTESSVGVTKDVTITYDTDNECSYIAVSLKRYNKEGYGYQYSLLENSEAESSNIIAGVALDGNIEGALGVFTCYTEDEVYLSLQ